MRFPIQLVAAIALAGTLAACEHKFPDWPEDGYTTLSTPVAHPVLFAPQASSLSATERARLVEFVRGAGLAPGSNVTVAAGGPRAAARQEAVAAVLRGTGRYSISLVNDPSDSDSVQVAAAGQQALWPKRCMNPDGSLPEDLPMGCASDLNLALQVERKSDLFQGRQMGPAFANPSVRAAERYLQLDGTDNTNTNADSRDKGSQAGMVLPPPSGSGTTDISGGTTTTSP
ncbi:CpaD family pilus assembly lipoprotein [Inquilinus sp.]|jgi:type IV pilus biogenesis protein CpaD/CtpE|uniref:CpaD family pilus assembly lipoprotein n=1 Tax=Inquilinus sp. TaxID=1932117 RepID=UPI0037845A99